MELTGKRFWILGLQLIVIVSILSCTTKKISSPVALGNIFTPAFFQTEEYLSVIDYLGKNLCLQDEMERYTYKICVKIDSLGFVKQATLIDVVQHSHNDSILLYNSGIRSKGNMLPLFNTILLGRFLGEGKSI